MTSILKLSRDERVNTDVYDYLYDARVTTFAGGSYIVVWTAGDAYDSDIHAQRYDSHGNRLGDEFVVDATVSDFAAAANVLALAGGGFVVMWRDSAWDGPPGLALRVFDAEGRRVGDEFRIENFQAEATPSLIALADGGFALGWVDRATAEGGEFYTLFQRFDAAGRLAGERMSLAGGSSDYYTRLTALGNGDLLAVWSSHSNDILLQHYTADGATTGPVIAVDKAADTNVGAPHIAVLKDGGYVVAWYTLAGDYIYTADTICVRQFSAAGVATGPDPVFVGSAENPLFSDLSITALSDGGYVVAWLGLEPDNLTQWDVTFQRFDALGHKIGPGVVVDSVTDIEHHYALSTPSVAAVAGGGFVLSWTTMTPDGPAIIHKDYVAAQGGVGIQTLWGTADRDRLDGGSGSDIMYGGYGDDTYYVTDDGDVTVENAGEGVDLVLVRLDFVPYQLPDNIENVICIGTQAKQVLGNALSNRIVGNAARNNIDGGAGADVMVGGGGDDGYHVDNSGDIVRELSGEGVDTIVSDVSYALPVNCEILRLSTDNNINGIGNDLDNDLRGNNGANILNGRAGADVMYGALGNDTYCVDNGGDVVTERADEPVWHITYGIDAVIASISYALAANVENLYLNGVTAINGTGNGLDNIVRGNAAANILDGGAGADSLAGAAGDDTYYIDNAGDRVGERAGQGNDTVYTSVSFALAGAYVESLVLTGAADSNATGNAIANSLTGNSGNNILTGGGGADVFVFGAGGGDDTVTDFRMTQGDRIDLHAISGGVAYGGGVSLSQVGRDTVIDLGDGSSVTVLTTFVADLTGHVIW